MQRLDVIAQKFAKNPLVNELAVEIYSPKKSLHWQHGAPAKQYFIASTTKLYTTAIVFQLIDAGQLGLDQTALSVLGAETMRELHVFKGRDYAEQITVHHLLSHTSGLADYFEQKQTDGSSIGGPLLENNDRDWTFAEVLELNRTKLRSQFVPGSGRKAFYSDTNFQLLGKIIEQVTGESFAVNLQKRILGVLQLEDTYLFSANTLGRYDSVAAMLSGTQRLRIPQAMASFGCDGGMVSTTADGIKFLEAFMNGKLFAPHWRSDWADWRRIFFPLQYGTGVMRFQLPRIFTLFRKTPEFIGHSGASGAFLFYAPRLDAYFSGTVNQVKKRDLSFRLMLELSMALD